MIDTYRSYYTHNGKRYSTKLNMFVSAGKDLNLGSIEWHVPAIQTVLDKMVTTIEPTDSLDSLYLQRARQLRENNSYLVLMYSGGGDSHNILETFMFNGIFLDEILIYNDYDEATLKQWEREGNERFNAYAERYEAEYNAMPLAKYFIDKYSPHTKLTYKPNLQHDMTKIWRTLDIDTVLKTSITPLLLNYNPFRFLDIHTFNPEWKKKNITPTLIYGSEKPTIGYDAKGCYFIISDKIQARNDVSFETNPDGMPNHSELFYTHADTCKMLVKQCHVLLRSLPLSAFENTIDAWEVRKNRTKSHWTRKLEDKMNEVLYARKVPALYSALKPPDIAQNNNFSVIRKANVDTFPYDICRSFVIDSDDAARDNMTEIRTALHSELFSHADKQRMMQEMTRFTPTRRYYLRMWDNGHIDRLNRWTT